MSITGQNERRDCAGPASLWPKLRSGTKFRFAVSAKVILTHWPKRGEAAFSVVHDIRMLPTKRKVGLTMIGGIAWAMR